MGNQASMVNSMADKLFLPADLVLDGAPGPNSVRPGFSPGSPDRAHKEGPGGGAKGGSGASGRMRRRSPSAGGGLNTSASTSSSQRQSPAASMSTPSTAAGFSGTSAGPAGGMGILAFEVASAMQRALEIWEQLDHNHISKLRLTLQSEGVMKLVRSENALPWRLIGLEIQRDLQVLRAIVTALGKRGADPRLHTLERRFSTLDLGSSGHHDAPAQPPQAPGTPEPAALAQVTSSPSPSVLAASPLSSSSSEGISRSSSSNSGAAEGPGRPGEGAGGVAAGSSDDGAQGGGGSEAASSGVEKPDGAGSGSEDAEDGQGTECTSMLGSHFLGSPERVYPQSFLPKEEGFLLRYLEDMLAATSTLHIEMSTLDNLLPSSHPLRLSRMLRDLPPRPAASGPGQPPLPPNSAVSAPTGYVANSLAQERIAAQTKAVHRLQKESLWSESFDKCIVLLAAAVIILTRKFQKVFGPNLEVTQEELSNTLSAGGLALHYAHTLLLIDRIVGRPTMVLRVQRDELYQRLPSKVRHALRKRLKGKRRPFDLEAAMEIRHAMQDMLAWMLPLATATIAWQAEHSYGCHLTRRASGTRTLQVQTLHFADKDQFETLLVELLAGVSYFARPPGLTGLQSQEEASWKAWQSSGGDPRLAAARASGQAGGPGPGRPGGAARPGQAVQGRGPVPGAGQERAGSGAGAGPIGSPNGLPQISISTLWGEGMKKDGFSQALSAFGAAAKASYASAFFGDKAPHAAGVGGPSSGKHTTRPLGTGRKPSPARPRPQQNINLVRQASF